MPRLLLLPAYCCVLPAGQDMMSLTQSLSMHVRALINLLVLAGQAVATRKCESRVRHFAGVAMFP